MRPSLLALTLFALLPLGVCPAAPASPDELISPVQAIYSAAKVTPNGVKARFGLLVQASGHQDGNVYLNSELDYRDQRCLTVAIAPRAVRELKAKYTLDPAVFFKGKRVAVDGVARRVTIFIGVNGRKTDKFYYQTHVVVNSAEQIHLLPR